MKFMADLQRAGQALAPRVQQRSMLFLRWFDNGAMTIQAIEIALF
jgi:hypothetical protein